VRREEEELMRFPLWGSRRKGKRKKKTWGKKTFERNGAGAGEDYKAQSFDDTGNC